MVKPKSEETSLIDEIIFGIEDVKGTEVNIMDLSMMRQKQVLVIHLLTILFQMVKKRLRK